MFEPEFRQISLFFFWRRTLLAKVRHFMVVDEQGRANKKQMNLIAIKGAWLRLRCDEMSTHHDVSDCCI